MSRYEDENVHCGSRSVYSDWMRQKIGVIWGKTKIEYHTSLRICKMDDCEDKQAGSRDSDCAILLN